MLHCQQSHAPFGCSSWPPSSLTRRRSPTGFKPARQSNITLHISDHVRVDFKLTVGDTPSPNANSNYNSLQVNFTRRMARIDNASCERGVSDFDRTHILTASYIYEVPRITRRRFAGLFINGWQFSGITRINSGAAQNQRPNLIAPVTYPKTVNEWFSVASFGRPASAALTAIPRRIFQRAQPPQLHHCRSFAHHHCGWRRYYAKQLRLDHRHTRRAGVTVCIETLFLSETRNPWQSTNSANPLKA